LISDYRKHRRFEKIDGKCLVYADTCQMIRWDGFLVSYWLALFIVDFSSSRNPWQYRINGGNCALQFSNVILEVSQSAIHARTEGLKESATAFKGVTHFSRHHLKISIIFPQSSMFVLLLICETIRGSFPNYHALSNQPLLVKLKLARLSLQLRPFLSPVINERRFTVKYFTILRSHVIVRKKLTQQVNKYFTVAIRVAACFI
jgi:hypothetical protein